jgi:DNA-binding FrmR family transcriptional regulator
MAHIIRDKKKLLNRLSRISSPIDALVTAIDEEHECSSILQTIAACRGAINGLMAEVVEGRLRNHLADPDLRPTSAQARAPRSWSMS